MSHQSIDSREYEKQRESLNLFIKTGVAPSTTGYAGNTALYDAMEKLDLWRQMLFSCWRQPLRSGLTRNW